MSLYDDDLVGLTSEIESAFSDLLKSISKLKVPVERLVALASDIPGDSDEGRSAAHSAATAVSSVASAVESVATATSKAMQKSINHDEQTDE